MARYQKSLKVSSLGLVATAMVFYSHQLIDWYPEQTQPFYAVTGVERADENQASSQAIPTDDGAHEVSSTIEPQSIAEEAQDITTASENITVSGWVGTEFGESIGGETVVLYSPSQKTHYSVITNVSGEFKLYDLKPGWDYVLKVSPRGLFKRYSKSQIKLRSDQEVHNIVLESIPLGLLTGIILDPYGRPVSNIELFLQTVETDYWTADVITDANGSFSVAEFPKGRFKLAIRGQQILSASGLKFDPDTDGLISLTIDLGPYSLVGHIFDESGQTFDSADVFLNWALHENGVRIRSTRKVSANDSGKFQFTGLGPGDHELVVSAWRGNTFNQKIRQTVNVGVDSGELIIVFDTQRD
jgi:hypothetical protein